MHLYEQRIYAGRASKVPEVTLGFGIIKILKTMLGEVGGDAVDAIECVSDNGPGVPADDRERVFHRFHRLERSRTIPGSGLGLSLVKAVADIHGVDLVVRDADSGLQVVMRFQPQQKQTSATREDSFCKKGRTKAHA
jgi:nitrogen-specific signal transduction histidine kinase